MNILAIETSTEACSAALASHCDVLERFQLAPREHSALILPMIDELLAEAQLTLSRIDAVAFGRGPGSFTGLRIAAAVAQGIAFAADLPAVPVSTLAALACGLDTSEHGNRRVLTALDARMGEVYWATYLVAPGHQVVLRGEEILCPPQQVPLPVGGRWHGLGPGWKAHGEALRQRLGARVESWDGQRLPRAREVALLGREGLRRGAAVPAEQALPVYLRDSVIQAPAARR